jgi:succinate dehydrogenase flavin-adding protein (antitoxin of CptAB toxin-antitoxin module)
MLGGFAEVHPADFDSAQLERLQSLLDCGGCRSVRWIIGGSAAPEEFEHASAARFRLATKPKWT